MFQPILMHFGHFFKCRKVTHKWRNWRACYCCEVGSSGEGAEKNLGWGNFFVVGWQKLFWEVTLQNILGMEWAKKFWGWGFKKNFLGSGCKIFWSGVAKIWTNWNKNGGYIQLAKLFSELDTSLSDSVQRLDLKLQTGVSFWEWHPLDPHNVENEKS